MSRWVAALRLTGVGFYISGCIVLGIVAGLWIDGKLNTEPLFMLLGLLFGLGIAVFGVYHMIRPLINNSRDKENG